jgi:hypothetical protein
MGSQNRIFAETHFDHNKIVKEHADFFDNILISEQLIS